MTVSSALAQFAQFSVWSAAGELLGAWLVTSWPWLQVAHRAGLLLVLALSANPCDWRAEQEAAKLKCCWCSQPRGRAGWRSPSGHAYGGTRVTGCTPCTGEGKQTEPVPWGLPAAELHCPLLP